MWPHTRGRRQCGLSLPPQTLLPPFYVCAWVCGCVGVWSCLRGRREERHEQGLVKEARELLSRLALRRAGADDA